MLEINKLKAKSTIILTLIIFLFLIMLSFLIFFLKPIREEKLISTINYVLEQKEESRYQIGKSIDIQLPISNSSYFFELTDTKDRGNNFFVVITRITGFNGPMATVFVGDEKSIELFGIAGIEDSQKNPLEFGITETMVNYWEEVLIESYTRGKLQ